jgi:hypothetical protein
MERRPALTRACGALTDDAPSSRTSNSRTSISHSRMTYSSSLHETLENPPFTATVSEASCIALCSSPCHLSPQSGIKQRPARRSVSQAKFGIVTQSVLYHCRQPAVVSKKIRSTVSRSCVNFMLPATNARCLVSDIMLNQCESSHILNTNAVIQCCISRDRFIMS